MEINDPNLWRDLLPVPAGDSHKYKRGHALVHGAADLIGATNLAASACNRIGAGLTTVVASENAELYQAILPPDIMVRKVANDQLKNVTAVLAGPGGATKDQTNSAINNPYGATCILDASAIPLAREYNYQQFANPTVITPHDGEFAKSFPKISGERIERAIAASKLSGAIVVLKGSTTIIANPDGRCVLNDHSSPWLAKAGTGDVLAGMITGLAAQGMPLFEACAAACWMHGEAGKILGAGLIASDIEKILSNILKSLFA